MKLFQSENNFALECGNTKQGCLGLALITISESYLGRYHLVRPSLGPGFYWLLFCREIIKNNSSLENYKKLHKVPIISTDNKCCVGLLTKKSEPIWLYVIHINSNRQPKWEKFVSKLFHSK